jgi:hypothetical protein
VRVGKAKLGRDLLDEDGDEGDGQVSGGVTSYHGAENDRAMS